MIKQLSINSETIDFDNVAKLDKSNIFNAPCTFKMSLQRQSQDIKLGEVPSNIQYLTIPFCDRESTNLEKRLCQLEYQAHIDGICTYTLTMNSFTDIQELQTNANIGIAYDSIKNIFYGKAPTVDISANSSEIVTAGWVRNLLIKNGITLTV